MALLPEQVIQINQSQEKKRDRQEMEKEGYVVAGGCENEYGDGKSSVDDLSGFFEIDRQSAAELLRLHQQSPIFA